MNGSGGGADGKSSIPTAYLPKGELTTLAIGSVLNQRYLIDKVLGLGGMGAVYRVRDLRFANAVKHCAVKEMIAKFSDPLDERTRLSNFEREANILASLTHLAIPAVHDYFLQNERAYLVMEYIEGRNLEVVLNEPVRLLGEQTVGRWAIQL